MIALGKPNHAPTFSAMKESGSDGLFSWSTRSRKRRKQSRLLLFWARNSHREYSFERPFFLVTSATALVPAVKGKSSTRITVPIAERSFTHKSRRRNPSSSKHIRKSAKMWVCLHIPQRTNFKIGD